METEVTLLCVTVAVLVGSGIAKRVGLPAPLILLVIGIIGSWLPFIPEVALSPDLVLLAILPPLLYAAALNTSLIDFAKQRFAILSLAVGLVLFTALGVGLFLHWVIGVPFFVGFALGAVVAPPDAVAATAVGRQIGLPRRIVSLLEGESLVNDATALVSLRTAISAAGLLAGAHAEVTASSVAIDFLRASLGGILVGVVVALGIARVRRWIRDASSDTVLSFTVPFLAYLPAEEIHASGVIAVVTAGLILGHKAPLVQTAESRISERINWSAIVLLLENAVFLLIGLQVFYVIERVRSSDLGTGTILYAALGTFALVLLLRPVWIFAIRWFAQLRGKELVGSNANALVISWAGMRGVVTLAAALTLPRNTPHVDVLILIAVVVTIGTLMLQGLTLPRLAKALHVRGPDPREDALAAASVMQGAAKAGLAALDADGSVDKSTRELLKARSDERVNQMWEQLGRRGGEADETPSDRYRRGRLEMLEAERAELLRIRGTGEVDQDVLKQVLAALDLEETMLQRVIERADAIDEAHMLEMETPGGDCEHLTTEPLCHTPNTPEGCEECLRDGTPWVHLRMCTHCGHVGCCDSSVGKHATKHFEQSGHPVMRSLEPGETWRWCFIDEVTA